MPRRTSFMDIIFDYHKRKQIEDRKEQRRMAVEFDLEYGEKQDIPDQFYMTFFNFDKNTRKAIIEFRTIKTKQRIIKYRQKHYRRIPIYSHPTSKIYDEKKVILLTDERLKHLNYDSDPLIRRFSSEIIEKINDKDLTPTWYSWKFLNEEERVGISNINSVDQNVKQLVADLHNKIERCKTLIQSDLKATKELNSLFTSDKEKQCFKVEKIVSKRSNKVLNISTLGLNYLLNCKLREKRIKNDIVFLEKQLSDADQFCPEYSHIIENLNIHEEVINDLDLLRESTRIELVEAERKKTSSKMIHFHKYVSGMPPKVD